MDGIAIVLVLVGVLLLVIPFVALALSVGARRRVGRLEAANEARKKELRYLYEQVKELQSAPPARSARKIAETDTHADVGSEADRRDDPDVVEAADTAPVAPATTDPAAIPIPRGDNDTDLDLEPAPVAARTVADDADDSAPAVADEPPVEEKPTPPKDAIEQQIATWFTRVGAGALLLGLLYAFKYLADNDYIGPTGRVAVGMLTGVAILVASEVMRKSTRPAFVHALTGLGLAGLFISIYASSAFYQLVPTAAAFVSNAVVLLLGAALAWRHRGEAILVLVSVATVLNPLLLSTGQDRPVALFGYLLVISSVTLFISAKRGFVIASWVAIGGIGVVAAGWYGKYFDVRSVNDRVFTPDVPAEELIGAYHEMRARIAPLLFAAAFSLQWVASGLGFQRLFDKSRQPTPLILAGLVFSHLAATALLYDRPIALAIAIVAAALLAVATLLYVARTAWLLVPMGVAAISLLARIRAAEPDQQVWLLALLGAWTAVYVVAFVVTGKRVESTLGRGDAIRAAIALALFSILSAVSLVPDERIAAFGAILAGIAAATALVAHTSKTPWLLAGSWALSALVFAIAVAEVDVGPPVDFGVLLAITGWGAMYMGAVGYRVFKDEPVGWPDLVALLGAALSVVALSIAATPDDARALRALITAGSGVAVLAFATWVAQSGKQAGPWISIAAVGALGLFAAAVAFALSGATITVVWAIFAVIAAWIASRSNEPSWLVAFSILVVAVLVRIVAIDAAEVDELLRAYRYTGGREGLYQLTPFANPRALALGGAGLAFALSAWPLRSRPQPHLQWTAGIVATLGYILIIIFAVTEVKNWLIDLPIPPDVLLDGEEFDAFWETVQSARREQRSKLSMATTITLASIAMTLLGAGFTAKSGFHRYLGLFLFLATIGKLVAWDVWQFPRVYQIVVLTIVGGLLVACGFLYARLKALFTTDTNATAIFLALLMLTAAAPADAQPFEPHAYTKMRTVEAIDGPGDYTADVDLDLYRASLAVHRLNDLRIVGPDSALVPFVIRTAPQPDETKRVRGRMLDPGRTPDGAFRALFEVPRTEQPHCRVDLRLDVRDDHLHRTRVETGQAPDDLAVVAEGAPIYSIGAGNAGNGTPVRHHTLRYPDSIAPYVAVTVIPDSGTEPPRILGATFFCSPIKGPARFVDVPIEVVSTERDAETKETIVTLDAGAEGVPIEALRLDVTTDKFVRRVTIEASSHKSVWPFATSCVLYRVGRDDSDGLRIQIKETRKRWLRLRIRDGDDAPLEITGATAETPRRWIHLRAARSGPHTLYVGDKAGNPPQFDLQQILARETDAPPPRAARFGAIAVNPAFGEPEPDERLPFTERYRGAIGVGLTVLLLGLGVWAVRLIRTHDDG